MIIKPTGRTVASANGTINYLGTTGNKTKAHQNPGLTKYRQARQLYNKTHLNKYHQMMDKYKVYTHRDLYTFGNFDTSNTRAIKRQIHSFMSGTHRKVQTREFVIMPSDSDSVKATDGHSVYEFAKFVHSYIARHFKDNFHYYAVIAPDSRHNSRVHSHIVVVNDNLKTHKAMAGHYYNIGGKHGLRADLEKTITDFKHANYSTPKPTISSHKPTPSETRIINKMRKAFQNLQANKSVARKVTSQTKFKDYLKRYGIKANYRSTTRHYKKKKYTIRGWKFKLLDGKRHPYIKASRISKAVGGKFLSTKNIAHVLTSDRRLNASLKRRPKRTKSATPQSDNQSKLAKEALHQKIKSKAPEPEPTPSYSAPKPSSSASYVASSSSSPSAQSSSINPVIQQSMLISKSSVSASESVAKRKIQYQKHHAIVQQELRLGKARAFASLPSKQRRFTQQLSNAKHMAISPQQSKMIKDYQNVDKIRHASYVYGLNIMNAKYNIKGDPGYTYWCYQHAIPARVTGYDGEIPIFSMENNPRNVSLLHKLTDPIIRGFKRHAPHMYEKFTGIGKAIRYYGQLHNYVYEPSISDYAQRGNTLGRPMRQHKANVFRRAWHGIKTDFEAIIHPVRYHYEQMSSMASSASSASASLSAARFNSIQSITVASQNQADNAEINWQASRDVIKSSDSAWKHSFALDTPAGRYAKRAVNSGLDTTASAYNHLIKLGSSSDYQPAESLLQSTIAKHQPSGSGKGITPKTPGGDGGDEIE